MTVMSLLAAIARQEGFFVAGSRPNRNNNPGDIEYGRFAIAHGAVGTDDRFAIFSNASAGFAAMAALFRSAYLGLTIQQAIAKWAPSSENDVATYVDHVCEWTGLTPDTVIDDYLELAA